MKISTPRSYISAALNTFMLCILVSGCEMKTTHNDVLPRNLDLPLFEPHSPSFNCVTAITIPFDAQADAWFHESRALESPEILEERRDYKTIVALTRRAAERRHWKAMLNLASFYLEGRDPPHGVEDAVQLVEEAMRLGAPAAFERMGTYYMNGTGVRQDATRAYAFWQRAAQMGSPEALTTLGAKMLAKEDDPKGALWANSNVGTKMLECAYGQGYGNAAYQLGLVYSIPLGHNASREELALALKVLHDGVKFGCQKCAAKLSIEFDNAREPSEMIAPMLDKARAARYRMLSRALDFNPDRRFPNLEKILPLPPADLPPWNGDRDTLLNAARGVTAPRPQSKPTAFSERKARLFLAPPFLLAQTDETTDDLRAPFAGYWQPQTEGQSELSRAAIAALQPALYAREERFDYIYYRRPDGGYETLSKLKWELWRTVLHEDPNAVAPSAASGLTRETAQPEPARSCPADEPCPVTGTWQPWANADDPLHAVVNHYWRQAWVVAGQTFPRLHDPTLRLPAPTITWHLIDNNHVETFPS